MALDPADAAGPSTTDGCSPLTNAAAVDGNIAVVDRGTCGFAVKVKNAQNAGAIGVIVVNNVPGDPGAMGGSDPTITIPSVQVSQAEKGALLEIQSVTEAEYFTQTGKLVEPVRTSTEVQEAAQKLGSRCSGSVCE